MAYEIEETIDGTKYKVAAINTGQMRQIREWRDEKPNAPLIIDNIWCVVWCLNNGGSKTTAGKDWDVAAVEALPWPLYKALLDVANKVSRFEVIAPGATNQGEAPATLVPR